MKADKEPVMRSLKTARGQLEGIMRMVEEDRYCVDISHQLLATQALLRKINKSILHAHLEHCVAESLETHTDVQAKITEIMSLLDTLSR
ncbi:MAG: metal-sensing transcriptional repressor [Sphaerochaetaceae bacterium]|jgi:DNA-binding FrmR family transcriptional regulator|nr:metal-sensing transcriptional repressor [Sphaerochaetaceae bacterium]NLO61464.1 metal-sensing transcriptional repressor [Spirochaetales bacterium]MDD2407067.1 metal-sensing transcriptional repressor [Sphaerochaetaceae bacterium]MDD3670998.1 metal-sensing transcriptional repressor [Sphaerochaetaceae bacterium]MDD4259008.1 metal-sensing transcriptional repressor [Sphaerochaetaceae bacterium]